MRLGYANILVFASFHHFHQHFLTAIFQQPIHFGIAAEYLQAHVPITLINYTSKHSCNTSNIWPTSSHQQQQHSSTHGARLLAPVTNVLDQFTRTSKNTFFAFQFATMFGVIVLPHTLALVLLLLLMNRMLINILLPLQLVKQPGIV